MSSDLTEAAQCLADTLARENEALKRVDYAAAVALLPAKEAALDELARHPRPTSLPPKLAALGRSLGDLAAENQILLERAVAVQTRVVRIVVNAVKPAPAARPYGTKRGRSPSERSVPMAISTRA